MSLPRPVYGLRDCRITIPGARRITFQVVGKSGLELAFHPEGRATILGSAARFERAWVPDGFRPTLTLQWPVALESTQEEWDAVNNVWSAPRAVPTALAVLLVFNAGLYRPVEVMPHLDNPWAFWAQPDPGKSVDLQDIKGVVHSNLSLTLVGTGAGPLPAWS